MKAAYADPPYLGCGAKHYGERHEAAAEYDTPEAHRRLIERLCDEFDTWALSLHEPSLRTILAMCPDDVRVAAWVKPFAAFKANVTRAWAWEPVIFRFARICEASGLDIALFRAAPEDNLSALLVAWYAEHLARGGAPDAVQEQLLAEVEAEDTLGAHRVQIGSGRPQ